MVCHTLVRRLGSCNASGLSRPTGYGNWLGLICCNLRLKLRDHSDSFFVNPVTVLELSNVLECDSPELGNGFDGFLERHIETSQYDVFDC